MSSKRKKNARAAAIRRIQTEHTRLHGLQDTISRIDAMQTATEPGSYLSSLPETERLNFLEVAALMEHEPAIAAMVAALNEDNIIGMIIALAHPDMVGNPDHEYRLDGAAQIRQWHILNQVTDFIPDWPPLVTMTDEDILQRIDEDRDKGLIPRPEE